MNILDTLKNKSKNSKQNTILRKAENRKQVTSNHKQVLLSAFRLFDYLVVKAFPLSAFYVVTVFCFFSAFLLSCNNSTDPKEDLVTFSGTVTLEDTTDFSGVTVSLYAPVELDTALARINQEYPNIGVQISQETEFDHREHEALYSTTTKADGSWEIKAEEGTYNVVVEKEGWGWGIQYNKVENSKSEINLNKPLVWSGTINQSKIVPEGSFVKIVGNTVFLSGAQLVIEKETIVEFYNSSSLKLYDKLVISGEDSKEVYFVVQDTSTASGVEIFKGNSTHINYLNSFNLRNGFYLKNTTLSKIQNSRFKNGRNAIEYFNCDSGSINNCYINNTDNGIIENSSNNEYKNIIIYNIKNVGISALNSKKSRIQYNIFKSCKKNGVGLNDQGYGYIEGFVYINSNNFSFNNNHIFLGTTCAAEVTDNNLINEIEYAVKTSKYTLGDTLNFKYNYWNTINTNQISEKIYDKLDRIGEEPEGPVVNFDEYKSTYIHW
jgi:hypothetical protein